jgi:hypothetical protein
MAPWPEAVTSVDPSHCPYAHIDCAARLVIPTEEPMRKPRSRNRRTELQRLVDLTVLGPTHPELGTCWQFTGTTLRTGGSPRRRTATPTDSAGSSSAAPFLRAGNCIIVAASMPAGTLTIYSWSLTPRIWRSSARRIASMGTRYRVTTSGSTPGQGHESAGHAFGRTNGGFARRWAEPKPAIQAPPDKPANPVARLVDLVPSSSAFSTAQSWNDTRRHGHPLSGANVRINPRTGARICRECSAEHQRAFRERLAPPSGRWNAWAPFASSPIRSIMLTAPSPSLSQGGFCTRSLPGTLPLGCLA